MNRPVPRSASQTLITGVYRTGSEYLAQLVGMHPHISVSMYSVNVLRFIHGMFDPIDERDNYIAALDALDARLRARYEIRLDRERVLAVLDGAPKVTYGLFYDTAMSTLYLRDGISHWAEKNQLLWRKIPEFLKMMPNGKTILIVRDPRSVLVSFKNYTYAPPPAYLGAIFNSYDALRHALRYQRQLPAERFRLLRYEDVAAAPQDTAIETWRFLGLDSPYPDVTQQGQWKDAHGNPWRVNSSFHANDDTRAFDTRESVARWRAKIRQDELDLTEIVCADLMRQFGYEPASSTPDWPSALRLALSNDQVSAYFKQWLLAGEGIEAFPTDPLLPENWRNP